MANITEESGKEKIKEKKLDKEIKPEQVFLNTIKTLVENLLIKNPNTSYDGYYVKNKISLREVSKNFGKIILDKIEQLEHLVTFEEINTIYLIEEHETSDFCGIVGSDFTPEGYKNKEVAEKRYEQLKSERGEHSGFYYSFTEIKLK